MTFSELGLSSEVLQALSELGFESPTPIQEKAIPNLLDEGADLVGLAQTGTGKTAAFGIPMIERVDLDVRSVQGLVICPTRELCMQITEDIRKYAKYKNLRITAIYGGASIDRQAKDIKKGTHIVVATPGRLIDMIGRRLVKIKDVNTVVLDEADEMLNMGFKEDIDKILENTPIERNTWLFSATMPKEVARIAKNYMNQPLEISVGNKNESAANVTHAYYIVNERDRYYALKRLLDYNPDIFGLVFCRTRRETQQVASNLIRDGYNAEALHGELSQQQRDSVMGKFRERVTQILVATDVAARGIDVSDITHVINYNLPDEVENYTHRSGRTARAGKYGESLVLINTRESGKINRIEKIIGKKFEKRNIPEGEDICEKQLMKLVDEVVATEINKKAMSKYEDIIYEKLGGMEIEDLVHKFLSMEFNRFLDYYKNSKDLNAKAGKASERGARKGERNIKGDTQRFFINKGRMDNINPGALVRAICDHAKISSGQIGEIDIMREFSFFEIEKDSAASVLSKMNGAEIDGDAVKVELAGPRKGGDRSRQRRSNNSGPSGHNRRNSGGGRRDGGHGRRRR
ncbi:MAG: DEAD/DEAH box helicase [Crocinitomicaceae bacterium]|jgi:ATP-dependent RNA helicase DeaD|nr:DEAD/DEAH box helicase [Crocinitomicaceae bacterium]MBT6029033.1 DEAD/DEAH box helicase [Crocinitomicaceae bacterium]MBT6513724.1 DEAD/DEAH box helicase [Crocinitomicaceae bacterium]